MNHFETAGSVASTDAVAVGVAARPALGVALCRHAGQVAPVQIASSAATRMRKRNGTYEDLWNNATTSPTHVLSDAVLRRRYLAVLRLAKPWP